MGETSISYYVSKFNQIGNKVSSKYIVFNNSPHRLVDYLEEVRNENEFLKKREKELMRKINGL